MRKAWTTYFSRKLLPWEQRYAVIEKEYLAIKLEVETFAMYLMRRNSSSRWIIVLYSGFQRVKI